ncbi:tRNA(His) guanylyltransferase Thg1 family protein [Loktanella sp. DJP18]|uniref:tRNA(His) guanylyltransferase Thg1 family protein n=1 Tax=Loktanella sp. DJP18 TaxID=3409788 RepID=UPI003BB7D494
MFDPLGDLIKTLERETAGQPIPANHAIYARIDGRGFSRFTRDMQRPFDPRMTRAMQATSAHLLHHTHATAAYVQSDEISLLFAPAITDDGTASQHFFGGKILKMTSVLAALATAAFTRALLEDQDGLAAWTDRMPHFDARVVDMPRVEDAIAAFAWRGQDARRNGIRQLGSAHFSHHQMDGKSNREVIAMLASIGITLEGQPDASMNGTLMSYITVARPLTDLELHRIPADARPAPGTLFSRRAIVACDTHHPGLMHNLADVLLDGAAPDTRPAPEYSDKPEAMSIYPA